METLHATEALRVDDVVLIPVQRVCIEPSRSRASLRIHAYADPRAIVVGQGGRWWALGVDGMEIALKPLLREVAGLANAVQQGVHR